MRQLAHGGGYGGATKGSKSLLDSLYAPFTAVIRLAVPWLRHGPAWPALARGGPRRTGGRWPGGFLIRLLEQQGKCANCPWPLPIGPADLREGPTCGAQLQRGQSQRRRLRWRPAQPVLDLSFTSCGRFHCVAPNLRGARPAGPSDLRDADLQRCPASILGLSAGHWQGRKGVHSRPAELRADWHKTLGWTPPSGGRFSQRSSCSSAAIGRPTRSGDQLGLARGISRM